MHVGELSGGGFVFLSAGTFLYHGCFDTAPSLEGVVNTGAQPLVVAPDGADAQCVG